MIKCARKVNPGRSRHRRFVATQEILSILIYLPDPNTDNMTPIPNMEFSTQLDGRIDDIESMFLVNKIGCFKGAAKSAFWDFVSSRPECIGNSPATGIRELGRRMVATAIPSSLLSSFFRLSGERMMASLIRCVEYAVSCEDILLYGVDLLSGPPAVFQEQITGIMGGYKAMIVDKSRYDYLITMRPQLTELAGYRREVVGYILSNLYLRGIFPVSVYSRIKTIGSLDRKERYAKITYPHSAAEFIREDFIGITVVVRTVEECYKILAVLHRIGKVSDLGYRPNPRDYIKDASIVCRPEIQQAEAIIVNMQFEDVPHMIHVRIFTQKGQKQVDENREGYKRRVQQTIRKQEV